MITNLYSHVEFYCMAHKKPVPLYEYETSHSPFYACPKYMRKDAAHPNGHGEDEPACSNRLSFNLAVAIMEKITSIIESVIDQGFLPDFTSYRFTYNNVEVTILEYSMSEGVTKVGVLNENEINAWK